VCPYCRFPLKEGVGVEACRACGAVHHVECWQDNGGCSITGCADGPSSATATHVLPPQAAPAAAFAATAAAPFPSPPSKPPPPSTGKNFPTAAVIAGAVLVALLGAGAAVATSSSSKKPTPAPATVTVKERTVEKAAALTTPTVTRTARAPVHHSTPVPSSPAPSSEPSSDERAAHAVEAVDNYWSDIEDHDFSGAYDIEEPIAQASESSWMATEEKEGVDHVSYNFEPGQVEGNEATVNIGSLQTEASKSGCFTWTGYYRLTDYSGTWKITHDGLERHSC
jgi:hypothetical protein